MKFFWPILLVCLVFGNTKPDEKALNRLAKVAKFLKVIDNINERKRKLQSTDDTTGDTTDEATIGNNTVIPIDSDFAKAPMERKTGNKSAPFQIIDFFNFDQKEDDAFFSFNMLFEFIKKRIASLITMRLRIVYTSRRLRNLAAEAQVVGCNCSISSSDSSKVGVEGTGENITYSCKGEKDTGRMVSNVNLDTTEPICFADDGCYDFTEVNFSDEADRKAGNITAADEVEQTSTNPVYRKSSSGLSGGAIAGIVIACVAVLIAAAVAAIMLRKPTPPINNTTVVDLKQENI